jgi:hypothetical protein
VLAAGRVVAIAMDRQRLVAELLASQVALRESRARLADAADQERRRIARNLHDGLQAKLVLSRWRRSNWPSSPVTARRSLPRPPRCGNGSTRPPGNCASLSMPSCRRR